MANTRSKGGGGLVKKGKWYLARWRVDGKTYTRSTKCTTKEEALKKLAEFVAPFQIKDEIERLETLKAKITSKKASLNAAEAQINKVKFDNLMDEFTKRTVKKSLSERTKINYESAFSLFETWSHNTNKNYVYVEDVTTEDAKEYVDWLSETRQPRTINGYMKDLKAIWTGLEVENVWKTIPKIRELPSKRRPFTDLELKKVFDYLGKNTHPYDKELLLLFKIGLMTGLRLYDAAHLKMDSIDFKGRFISLLPHKTQKNGVYVTIPVADALAEAINEYLGSYTPTTYLMPTMAEKYDNRSLSYAIRNTLLSCGLETMAKTASGNTEPILSFHALRHTFVSKMANSGMPQQIVKSIVGHSSEEMTNRYFHANLDIAAAYMNGLNPKAKNVGESKPETFEQSGYVYVPIKKEVYLKLLELAGDEGLDKWLENETQIQVVQAFNIQTVR